MNQTEPVLLNGTAASIAAAATPVLIALGVSSGGAGRIGSYVGAGLALVLAVWHLFSARSKVTPLGKMIQAEGIVAQGVADLQPIAVPAVAPAPAPSPPADEVPIQAD